MSTFIVRAAGDFFGYVSLFQAAPDAQRPAAPALRSHLVALLDRFQVEARSRHVAEREIDEARFALAAWADEQVLASEWMGTDEWQRQPLQLLLFGTVRAGNEFYERLGKLGSGEEHALEIYFFCLLMGFRGELATEPERRNGLLRQIYEALYAKRRIVPALEGGELAETAYAWEFSDQQPGGRRVAPLLGWMGLGMLALYALCWAVLRYSAHDMLAGLFA